MRSRILALALGLAACGNDSVPAGPDAPGGNRPDPRVIPGGGIGDGPIDGVVNLYVIDDLTREPIEGAEVQVGTVSGATDATGLFVAEGVTGPQDIVVRAAGNRRAEMWVGANGANVTVNLAAANIATSPSADLSGSIPNLVTSALPPNHTMVAIVSYSQTDDIGDPANELAQAMVGNVPQNMCFVQLPTQPCNFTITTRTGRIALLATIIDNDSKGNADPADDTNVVVGFAVLQGLTVEANQDQTNRTLTVVPAGMLQDVTLDLGTPPAALLTRAAAVLIELGDEGVLPIGFVPAATPTVRAPRLAALSGATAYRMIGIATDAAPTDARQSIVLRRGLAGPTLAAGEWLEPPGGVTVSRTTGAWNAVTGATAYGVEISQAATRVLNVTVFDGATEVTLPELVALPSGELSFNVTAIGATEFDVTDFALDTDATKLDRVAAQVRTVN